MPRYYFNTRIGDELISDPDGEVLRDSDRAWEMARAMIRELLKTEGTDGALLNATIEVTDDQGEIVLEFPFAEAILDAPDRSVTKHSKRRARRVRRYTTSCVYSLRVALARQTCFPIAHRRKNVGEWRPGKPPARASCLPARGIRLPPGRTP